MHRHALGVVAKEMRNRHPALRAEAQARTKLLPLTPVTLAPLPSLKQDVRHAREFTTKVIPSLISFFAQSFWQFLKIRTLMKVDPEDHEGASAGMSFRAS